MAWTVAGLEQALVDRTDSYFDFFSWSTTADGSNATCAGPIRDALLLLEYSVDDLSQPVDSDLSSVDSTDTLKILEVAEVFLLDKIINNLGIYVDIQVGQRDEKLSQMMKYAGMAYDRKVEQLQLKYGLFYTPSEIGKVNFNFQTKADDAYPE